MRRFIKSLKDHLHSFECEKHIDSSPELEKESNSKNVKCRRVKFALMTKVVFITSDDGDSTWYKVSLRVYF